MTSDRPNRLPWPPILYAIALLAPILLDWLIPLPVIRFGRIGDDIVTPIGWALTATGFVVIYLAVRSFAAMDTPVNPTAPAETLVTFGLYNRTRNPMYLAAVVAFAGLALSTGTLWRFAAVPLLVYGLQRLAIVREEAHLAARFGAAWSEYAARVPRWW